MHTILWRRLDVPGHDACHLARADGGWRITGAAVFRHELGAAQLEYELAYDDQWRTRAAFVRGWVGATRIDFQVRREESGAWMLGGQCAPQVDGCTQIDFGFTPATNLPQIRAMQLRVGASVDWTVAWLDVPALALEPLTQRYERVDEQRYAYESKRFGYTGVLVTDAGGFVREYPELWQAES